MARDRLIYRCVWLAAVALPLLAALGAIFTFEHPVALLSAVLAGLGLAAAALAAHLRLRIALTANRRTLEALRSATASPVRTGAPAVDAAAMHEALAAVERRLVEVLERAPESQVDPLSVPQVAAEVPAPVRGLNSVLVRRAVAVVGSDALIAALPSRFEVHRLFPALARTIIDSSGADTIIIEEQALAEGPWRTTLLPQGAALLTELREAMTGRPGDAPRVYVVAQRGMPGIAARGLRQGAVVIDDSFTKPSGPSATLLDALISYRETYV